MKKLKQFILEHAVGIVCKELRSSNSYYYGWQSNIAMCMLDEYNREMKIRCPEAPVMDLRGCFNEGAMNFLNQLSGRKLK